MSIHRSQPATDIHQQKRMEEKQFKEHSNHRTASVDDDPCVARRPTVNITSRFYFMIQIHHPATYTLTFITVQYVHTHADAEHTDTNIIGNVSHGSDRDYNNVETEEGTNWFEW